MSAIAENPILIAAFLCGVAAVYIVVMRTLRKRKE